MMRQYSADAGIKMGYILKFLHRKGKRKEKEHQEREGERERDLDKDKVR